MKEEVKVMISEEEITEKVKEIAAQINKDYADKEVFLLCILKGSVYFTCRIVKISDDAGQNGLYEGFQLWRRLDKFRCGTHQSG